ncbi:MAG TPA: cation diffusion facilitator family transporter [Actinomycetota bacterium]
MAAESRTTVLAALFANAVIAVAKLVGGLISGSSAMLAEAAHSMADTTNQGLLLMSISLGKRKPDERHPFGYGKERFFWAFVAAVFIFVAGSAFSLFEGVRAIGAPHGEGETGFAIPYVVLSVALVVEAIALWVAYRGVRREATRRRRRFFSFLRVTRDPTAKTALFEDAAAVTGVMVALVGVGLHERTGDPRWDAGASIVIGVILAIVAFVLARDTKALLLGEPAFPEERELLRECMLAEDGVEHVVELLTMAMGPESLLVTARLDLREGLDEDAIEAMAHSIDRRCREAVPAVKELFLDPTSRDEVRIEDDGGV